MDDGSTQKKEVYIYCPKDLGCSRASVEQVRKGTSEPEKLLAEFVYYYPDYPKLQLCAAGESEGECSEYCDKPCQKFTKGVNSTESKYMYFEWNSSIEQNGVNNSFGGSALKFPQYRCPDILSQSNNVLNNSPAIDFNTVECWYMFRNSTDTYKITM